MFGGTSYRDPQCARSAKINNLGNRIFVVMKGICEIAKEVIDIEIAALSIGKNFIDAKFEEAVHLIKDHSAHGRVVVMGMGKSGHIGNKISATLASTGTPAFFVHPAEAGHGDLGMITQNDIVIAISQSGKSEEILRLVPYFKRNSIHLIVMTGDLSSKLADLSDLTISTNVAQEACPLGLAPTASTTLTLALGDALAVCLLEQRGFSEREFAETHPHGALGRRLLLSVSDVMSDRAKAPIVGAEVSIRDSLITMSEGGLGFLVVTDSSFKPIGVFTDGDLRRCLDRGTDIQSVVLGDVMSTGFALIKSKQLAVEAVDLMEKSKISALPVVDAEGVLVGALNLRQLLQAGVV